MKLSPRHRSRLLRNIDKLNDIINDLNLPLLGDGDYPPEELAEMRGQIAGCRESLFEGRAHLGGFLRLTKSCARHQPGYLGRCPLTTHP